MTTTAPGFLSQPANTLSAITELWAFVSVDPTDGNEGVMGYRFGDTFMPLIAADLARLANFYPLAQQIARDTNRHVRLIRLSGRRVIVDNVLSQELPV